MIGHADDIHIDQIVFLPWKAYIMNRDVVCSLCASFVSLLTQGVAGDAVIVICCRIGFPLIPERGETAMNAMIRVRVIIKEKIQESVCLCGAFRSLVGSFVA